MSISMADAIRAQVAGLDRGQRQFLANHLWKHYRVAPQRLHTYLPEHVFEPEITLEVGQLVYLKDVDNGIEGRLGVIRQVDKQDTSLPYFVDYNGNDGADWFRFDQVVRFTPDK